MVRDLASSGDPVTVDVSELRDGSVSLEALEEAFGPSSLGIIVVKGLQPRFVELRHRLLSFSSHLANLPEEILQTLEVPAASYLTGWSRGKETLKSGRFDTLKGSYYVNCAFYNEAGYGPRSTPSPAQTNGHTEICQEHCSSSHDDDRGTHSPLVNAGRVSNREGVKAAIARLRKLLEEEEPEYDPDRKVHLARVHARLDYEERQLDYEYRELDYEKRELEVIKQLGDLLPLATDEERKSRLVLAIKVLGGGNRARIKFCPSSDTYDMPEYTSPNVWPAEDLLPGFRETCEELCTMIIDVAALVARACDRFAKANIEGYQEGYLERVVRTSDTTKARLLHYFSQQDQDAKANGDTNNNGEDADQDDWCATHVDHGCLTGLTSAMYVDEDVAPPLLLKGRKEISHPLDELPSSPDPEAGLYIHNRNGATTHVKIPRDCLAFQTGEALELITKGKFKAVPHFVRGVRGAKVARNTLAVFTQPRLGEIVDESRGLDFAAFSKEVVARHQ